jgi:hypothetical protein
VDKDRDVEDAIGILMDVLDLVVVQQPVERWKKSDAGSTSPHSMNKKNIRISSGFFSISYTTLTVVFHPVTAFSHNKPALSNA